MKGLPDYKIRWSGRAKRLSVQACLIDGLVMTAPLGMSPQLIPELLLTKKKWLVSMDKRLRECRASPDYVPPDRLPDKIKLRAIDRTFRVVYKETFSKSVRVQNKDDNLLVTGHVTDRASCRRALRRWLRRQGRLRLKPWLKSVSEEVGLSYTKAQVKIQRTRFGSCSPGKTISLNCKLLFLEPSLVRYLFIHELCHTVHLNHSEKYWGLLRGFVPDGKILRRRMKQEWVDLPLWTV